MTCIFLTPKAVRTMWCLVLAFAGILAGAADVGAKAMSPNGKAGVCGPYYIWYQTTPDVYPPLMDFVDLCGITFDIRDINQDFDFVYFTDTDAVQRAAFDQNHDGISDLFFVKKDQRVIEWKPEGGCVRIDLNQCQGGKGFDSRCGYAMISVQPKPNFRDGSANIHISVNAKCPPGGYDCSRAYSVVHQYANCVPSELPDFVMQKTVDPTEAATTYKEETFLYRVTLRNTGTSLENHAELTDTMSAGTKGGSLQLKEFSINCPEKATCAVRHINEREFKITFADIPPDTEAKVQYSMVTHKDEITKDEYSYFTNTATLSTGGSARVTVGVRGTKEEDEEESNPQPRQERPIPSK